MTLRAHLAGLALAALFTPATLLLCEALNRLGTAPKREGQAREVSFQVARAPQAPRKAATAPRPEERKAPAARGPRAALPPAPALGGDLGGVDLGLSDFTLEAVTPGADALGDPGEVVHTEDSVDAPPTPRVTTPVEVPAAARARNLSGSVVLSLRIGADGRVRSAKVVSAEPPGVFEEAALRAVRGWEFEPAMYHGQPVEVWATLPIEFQP